MGDCVAPSDRAAGRQRAAEGAMRAATRATVGGEARGTCGSGLAWRPACAVGGALARTSTHGTRPNGNAQVVQQSRLTAKGASRVSEKTDNPPTQRTGRWDDVGFRCILFRPRKLRFGRSPAGGGRMAPFLHSLTHVAGFQMPFEE